MRLKPLCTAFALGLYSAGTAHAGLQDDMNSFFNDMSYASNTTSAKSTAGAGCTLCLRRLVLCAYW